MGFLKLGDLEVSFELPAAPSRIEAERVPGGVAWTVKGFEPAASSAEQDLKPGEGSGEEKKPAEPTDDQLSLAMIEDPSEFEKIVTQEEHVNEDRVEEGSEE